jgi:hypothetical protein
VKSDVAEEFSRRVGRLGSLTYYVYVDSGMAASTFSIEGIIRSFAALLLGYWVARIVTSYLVKPFVVA